MGSKHRVILFKELRDKISSIENYPFLEDGDKEISKKIDELLLKKVKKEKPKFQYSYFKRYYIDSLLKKKLKISPKLILLLLVLLSVAGIATYIACVFLGVIK